MKIIYGIIGLVLILSSQMVHATTYGGPIGPVSIQMPFMKTNSNGTITIQYIEYYPHNSTMDTKFAIYDGRLQNPEPLALNDLTIQAEPESINLLENNTVTYTVVAKNNIKGVYAISPISASCGKYPLVIGLNESEIMPSTLFKLSMPVHCGVISSDAPIKKITNYDQIILKDVTRTQDQFSPIEQIQLGSNSTDVQCKQGFDLIIKTHDNMPACVKPDTANILIERGWATNVPPPNPMASLAYNEGLIIFKNQTYYFETPIYSHDAYFNPPQISFHDVTFTLFPAGFRGGLPIPCNAQGTYQYYWADAKFSDNTQELLHIQAESPPCSTNPIPIMFSNHTDPQAGLTFYDGKMKLLVSAEDRSQQNNLVLSLPNQTNETIYHDFPSTSGYSIVNTTQGIVVNDDAEASNLTGFDVQSPTYLPQGYEVKMIKASKEIPLVTIFASKYPLTDKTTSHDFLWNQRGILITYDPTNPLELKNYKQNWAAANKVTTINGSNVAVFDISKQYQDGYQYDMWGNVIAIKDNTTNIAIRGFFNSDDFIKMITSMLEK